MKFELIEKIGLKVHDTWPTVKMNYSFSNGVGISCAEPMVRAAELEALLGKGTPMYGDGHKMQSDGPCVGDTKEAIVLFIEPTIRDTPESLLKEIGDTATIDGTGGYRMTYEQFIRVLKITGIYSQIDKNHKEITSKI